YFLERQINGFLELPPKTYLNTLLVSKNSSIWLITFGRFFRISCDQKRNTVYPIFRRARFASSSFCMLRSIFGIQNRRLDLICVCLFFHWKPCQNSPSTKMASLYFLITMSGEPGSVLSCKRKRIFFAQRARRRIISGFEFLPLMRDMIWLRCLLV